MSVIPSIYTCTYTCLTGIVRKLAICKPCHMEFMLFQKLKRRRSTLQKVMKNDPARLTKWKRVLTIDMMSSEESDYDSGSDSEEVFKIRSLPWRSEKCNHFVATLDAAAKTSATRKSKQMRNTRIEGLPSTRRAPLSKFRDCMWAIKRSYHPVQQSEEP